MTHISIEFERHTHCERCKKPFRFTNQEVVVNDKRPANSVVVCPYCRMATKVYPLPQKVIVTGD